jgi:hypothetical protein
LRIQAVGYDGPANILSPGEPGSSESSDVHMDMSSQCQLSSRDLVKAAERLGPVGKEEQTNDREAWRAPSGHVRTLARMMRAQGYRFEEVELAVVEEFWP